MQTDDSFLAFCRNATDAQLLEILRREYSAGRRFDYMTAERAATERGWSYTEIKAARSERTL
jgi:hypothetical protein